MSNFILSSLSQDYTILIPEIFLATVFVFKICYGVFYTKLLKKPLAQNILWLSIWALIITVLLVSNSPYENYYILNRTFICDDLAVYLKIAILLCSICVLSISAESFSKTQMNHFEVVLLFLCACLSLMVQVTANDFLSLYLSLEFQTLTFYVLAASKPKDFFSAEAGLKYFILGALSSGLLVFGFSFIYGFTGTMKFDDLTQIIQTNPELVNDWTYPLMFIAAGLLFKFPAAPFHTWAPDVYEGSPTPCTAFFAIVPKLSIISVFIRFFWQTGLLQLDTNFLDQNGFFLLLLASSMLSLFVGAFYAIGQLNIKRLFAYSSIGHVGFLLAGLIWSSSFDLYIPLLYTFLYAILSLGLFSLILSFRKRGVSYRSLQDLRFLSQTSPLVAYAFTGILFSSAGIPPLAGFFPKAATLNLLIDQSNYFLSIWAILLSCVTCFYSLKVIQFLFFQQYSSWVGLDPVNRQNALILVISIGITLCYIVFPQGLNGLSHFLALSLSAPLYL